MVHLRSIQEEWFSYRNDAPLLKRYGASLPFTRLHEYIALTADDAEAVLSVAEGHDPADAYSRHNSFDNYLLYPVGHLHDQA